MHERLAWDINELTRYGGLLDTLTALLPETGTTPDTEKSSAHKISGSPPPWHAEAADVLMTIHAGARELESVMRYRVTGTVPIRGGSDGNTRAALAGVAALAGAVPDSAARAATSLVAHWVRRARQVRDIDQTERWVALPRLPGLLPPACPYCRTYALRMSRAAGEVRCMNAQCLDRDQRRPVARMEYGLLSGDGILMFADGGRLSYEAPADAASHAQDPHGTEPIHRHQPDS